MFTKRKKVFQRDERRRKMKIAQFLDTYYPTIDGVVTVVDNYARGLKRFDDVEDSFIVVPGSKGYREIDRGYEVLTSKYRHIPYLKRDISCPKKDKELKENLMKREIDLIHAHSPFMIGKYAVEIAKQKHIPVIGHFHTQYRQDFKKYGKLDFLVNIAMKYILQFYNSVDKVWTLTDNAVKVLRDYGYEGEAEVVLNGCDFEFPKDPQKKIELVNDKYRLQDSENVLLFVGQIIELKNVFMIADAVKLLKDRGQNVLMLFVGSGEDSEKLQKQIEALGIQDCARLLGRVSDREELSGLYLRCDMFIFPSMYDTSSLVKIEAAAHKLPSVMCKDAVSAHAIVDGVNGYLIENTAEALADKIQAVLSDKAKLEEVKEGAYRDLYLSWDSVLKHVHRRYAEVIEEYKKRER